MDNNKNIIMLSGKDDEFYEKAIFILKNNREKRNINLVKEAEKIVDDCLAKGNQSLSNQFIPEISVVKNNLISKRKNTIFTTERILNLCILISLLILAITLYTLFS